MGAVSAIVAPGSDRLQPSSLLAPGGHRRGGAAYRRIMIAMMAGGLANFALLYYVQPLLPALAARYGVSPGESSAALSVSTIAMAVALLVVGPISDAVGRVGLMRWSLVAAGVIGLASAFTPSWSVLLILRAAEGAALAVLPAVALAYLREEIDRSAHLRANAAYIAGTAVGGAFARLLPGWLNSHLGWSGTTVVMSSVTLVTAMIMWALLLPSRGFVGSRLQVGPVVRGTLRSFRDPMLLGLCVVGFAGMGTFVGVYNAIAFRLRSDPVLYGDAALSVYFAYPVGILAPWVARRLAARWARPVVILLGVGLLGAGLLVTAADGLMVMMLGLGAVTFAFLGTHSLTSGAVVDRARQIGVGVAQASGTYLLVYYVGGAVVGTLATHSWEVGGWNGVLAVCLVTVVLALAGAAYALRFGAPASLSPADRSRPAPT